MREKAVPSETLPLLRPAAGHAGRGPAPRAWLRLPLLAVLAFLAYTALPRHHPPRLDLPRLAEAPITPDDFNWADIPPARNLTWHPCYEGFQCSRLDVPIDWIDPTEDDRVVLAVIRLPAVNREDYRGPVIFNPGGPGGSGIWSIRDHGRYMQTIVGDNHDIVTFDPRGIGKSTPRVQCWEDYQRQHFWDLQDIAIVDAHPGDLYDQFARAKAYSKTCAMTNARSGILQHLSTASHARDMLEILHALGEDKLKYWGFSYGTVLGGTFASMYPDKVERLVSDGNVDYREWYYKERVNFLRDTDKVMAAFYELCHRAGPAVCAFYAESPAAIEARLEALLERLKRYPVIVPAAASADDGPEVPEIITYSKLRRLISSTLYQPHHTFALFARIVEGLDRDDGWAYYKHMSPKRTPFEAVCTAEPFLPTEPPPGLDEGSQDAFPAIMCSDSIPELTDADEFAKVAEELQEISRSAGAVNVLFRMSCVGWDVRPKFRYTGAFGGNTSFPILYVNNIADNVTPLISARNNSAGFPSSVLLVQHSYGHTSLASPSTCTARHIRAYFQEGVLPSPGTECLPDALPFGLAVQNMEHSPLSLAVHALSQRASAMSSRFWQPAISR